MDLTLTPEQKMIRDTARGFATRKIAPHARTIDREHRFPREIIASLGELGLMGVAVPQAWGGAGMDSISYVLALEEISRACAATGVIMSVNNSLVCGPLLAHGTDAQKRSLLGDLAAGRKLGCFALSEPESGSDAGALRTTARRAGAAAVTSDAAPTTSSGAGGGWILNGTKNFVTNGPVADVVLLLASTDSAAGRKGISAFVVDAKNPGLKFGPPDDKLGIRGAPSAQLFITDAVVPEDALLGQQGSGYKIALSALDGGRIGIAAQALGIARAALEDATAYALERKTFGQAIAQHQAIQFKLADMCTEIDAARLMIWRAAAKKDEGGRYTTEAAMAKLLASEVANRAAKEAVQIFGGYGYLTDFPVERHYRDAKITEIYEGTSEIQRLVIARGVLEA
jgi:butyryl-CoA dehydrogenase